MVFKGARIAFGFSAGILLCACAFLPKSGPEHTAIEEQSAFNLTSTLKKSIIDYVLVDLNAHNIYYSSEKQPPSLLASFGARRQGAPQLTIGTGDIVQVTIFESASGGLFIPNDAGSRPGNYVVLPNQTVDQSGFIIVPYAGQIRASGRNLAQIQREIESKLKNRAIEPQALVALVSQRSNEVAVLGEVGQPGKIQVNAGGEKILDVIAKAGGIRHPGYESFVSLQRGARKSTIFFPFLVQKPAENIYVSAGDAVYVYREPRSFLAFGATGRVGRYHFEAETLSLAEAVGRAGGLLDERANPGQGFIYRVEPRGLLERLGADLSGFPAAQRQIPTIYRANFRDPSTFFAAQRFQMRDMDVIYVSNAEAVELYKFLSLVSAVPNTLGNTALDAYTISNAGLRVRGR